MAKEPDTIRDGVADVNVKNLGDQPAFYAGLLMKDAAAHARAMEIIRESGVAAAIRKITEVDVTEAIAIVKATTGSDTSTLLANLTAAGAFGRQSAAGEKPK